jgi:hypothetical protein
MSYPYFCFLLTIIARPNKLDFVGMAQLKRPFNNGCPPLTTLTESSSREWKFLGAVK